MALKYPKCANVQVDLLAGKDVFPVGCVLKDGKLSPAFNAVDTFHATVKKLVCLRQSNSASGSLAYSSDGKVYRGDNLDATVLTQIETMTASLPFFIEQKSGTSNDLVLLGNTNYVRMRNGGYYKGELASSLRCGTIRCGRLFGIDRSNAYLFKWSGPGGYTDWESGISGAGQAYLEEYGGQSWEIFSLDDELVILREYGITRISAAGDPENFRLDGDTIPIPSFYRKTAALAGDGLYFCADGGLYRYKGGKVSKMEGLVTDDAATPMLSASYGGRYYLAAGISSRLSRRVVYIYDTVDKTYQVVDIPAICLSSDNRSMIGFAADTAYRIQNTGEYSFSCGEFDFGSHSRKLLTSLEADCDEGVEVSISNGRFTRTVTAGGKTRLNMRGVSFSVTVNGSGEVRSLKLNAEVRK